LIVRFEHSNRSAKRCLVAVRKRGARQKSLLLWMRQSYGVVQPSDPSISTMI